MRFILTLSLLVCLISCASTPEPAPPTLNVRADFGSDADGLLEGWMGYGFARLVGDPTTGIMGPSIDPPPFGEEAHARESLALIWGELADKHGYSNQYLEDLVSIEAAGFIREYTWICVQSRTKEAHFGLNLLDFALWMDRELPNHEVETFARAVKQGGSTVIQVGWQTHDPKPCGFGTTPDAA